MNMTDEDVQDDTAQDEEQQQTASSPRKGANQRIITFSDRVRVLMNGLLMPIGLLLHRLGITADAVTITGFIIVLIAGAVIVFGNLQLAGILLVVALPFDVIDGAVARASKHTTEFGALLDSTLDRYADSVIFASLGYHFAIQSQHQMLLICFVALIGSYGVSYVRARAESLGVDVKIGLFTRFERNIIILLMLFVPDLLALALVILAIGTNVTALQRLLFVYRSLKNREV